MSLNERSADMLYSPQRTPDPCRPTDLPKDNVMSSTQAPYHAHIYYDLHDRAPAEGLRQRLSAAAGAGASGGVVFVGEMRDANVGPHPKPQFEIHFLEDALPMVVEVIHRSGLTALVHPLTDNDLADHTSLGTWIGEPLPLDLSVLDPPGMNQGVDRFGKTDF
jgi:aromatic ring-cleaving dioxygenase